MSCPFFQKCNTMVILTHNRRQIAEEKNGKMCLLRSWVFYLSDGSHFGRCFWLIRYFSEEIVPILGHRLFSFPFLWARENSGWGLLHNETTYCNTNNCCLYFEILFSGFEITQKLPVTHFISFTVILVTVILVT